MSRFEWLELNEAPAAPVPEVDTGPPTDAAGFYRAARKLREAGHLKAAADYYSRAVGFDEHNHPATTELIDTLVRAGLLLQADQRSQDALENFRQVPLYYAARALVLAHRGALVDAWSLGQTAFDHSPHWYPKFVRGEMQLRAAPENAGEVVAQFDALVAEHPELWDLHFLAAWVLLEGNSPAQAAAFASEAAHIKPRAAASWIVLGDCFFALRLYDQAFFYYQRATELEASHPLALERQRRCSSLRYGLLRVFDFGDLRRRWTRRYQKERGQQGD
jgi:tetratricopeptide (TPR) repeat protein